MNLRDLWALPSFLTFAHGRRPVKVIAFPVKNKPQFSVVYELRELQFVNYLELEQSKRLNHGLKSEPNF